MSGLPIIGGRVPTLLSSQVALRSLTTTNAELLRLNTQLSSGLRIQRPSDDPVGASIVGVLDRTLERDGQRDRNLTQATSVLASVDGSLGQLNELLLEAKAVASSQVGAGSDAGTRAIEAEVIAQQLTEVLAVVNREVSGIHYFGGSATATPPVESFYGGYRYTGDEGGLFADLGPEVDFPITIGADAAVGALSARIEGNVDLDASLTPDTFVRDLRGPLEGRELGTLAVTIDDGGTQTEVLVDLSIAETVGDVTNLIESAVRDADPGAFSVAFPGGVATSNDQLLFSIAPGYTLTFDDGPIGETASALGLQGATADTANATPGQDLDPRITDRTELGNLQAPIVYGDIRIENGPRSGVLTTSSGLTVGELRDELARLDLGVRLEITENGDSLAFVHEPPGLGMSISDTGTQTATSLGLRTFMATTEIDELNDGRGISIADGEIDPVTGLPDPDRNVDFEVVLTDGTSFTVDLRPEDLQTIQTVLDRINAEFAATGLGGGFVADVDPATNGIRFSDTAGGPGPIEVRRLNGFAAEDLGLLDGTASGATLTGSDRATVRVDSLFSTLIDLRDALLGDDVRGITAAGTRLEQDIDRVAAARALVGTRSARVEGAQDRLGERMLLDESLRSELRDLDVVEAATRLGILQAQLQAGLTVTAQTQPLTLLNFLG